MAASGGLQGIINDGTGVGTGLVGDDVHPDPFPLLLKLVDGGGPEGIRRRQEDTVAVFLQAMGELGDRGGLAAAVNADQQDNPWRRNGGTRLTRLNGEHSDHSLFQGGTDLRAVELFLGGPLLYAANELCRGADADIGRDKQLFKLVPDSIVNGAAVEKAHSPAEPGIVGVFEGFLEDINVISLLTT